MDTNQEGHIEDEAAADTDIITPGDPEHTSSTTQALLEGIIKQEVEDIIQNGDVNEQEDMYYVEEPLEPILVTKHSNKTLRWIVGMIEAMYGAPDTPIFPMSNIPSIPFEERRILLLDYEISDFEQPVTYENVSTLSKLMNVRVKFRIGWSTEEKMESFIIKVPPEEMATRELADMARTDRREIFCYTRIFPYLQQWALEQNVEVVFAIPRCYFARINRKLDPKPIRNVLENIPDAESVLVFQDLRPLGFGKRHFVEGLMIDEVKAALCEIAKIHAITYSLQQRNNIHLTQIFGPLHKPLEVALMYDVLLEGTFPLLKKFLSNSQYDTRELIGKIKTLENRLRGVLTSLLEPHSHPNPTCLTHMDFWCDNIVFRRRGSWENLSEWKISGNDVSEKNISSSGIPSAGSIIGIQGALGLVSAIKSETIIPDSPLECRILDWQMVSYGRPSHDIALLLMTSLPTDIRRSSTNMFLKYYYQVFKETTTIFGAEIYFDLRWLHKEYKRSKLLAALFIIASIELTMSDPSTQERLIDILVELSSDGQI